MIFRIPHKPGEEEKAQEALLEVDKRLRDQNYPDTSLEYTEGSDRKSVKLVDYQFKVPENSGGEKKCPIN